MATSPTHNAACDEVYRRWRRYLSHDEALAQARLFARRCANLNRPADFDRVIDAVAEAMAAR